MKTIIILALIVLVLYLSTLRYSPERIEVKLWILEYKVSFSAKTCEARNK